MKYVLDACVLFPTVLREMLLSVAQAELFTPLWSERILGEWARAAARHGALAAMQAEADIARLRASFPRAIVAPQPGIESRLHLPDENDIHVLAVAIAGSADGIITFNAVDFPRHVLAAEGLTRRDPDGFLWELWSNQPDRVMPCLERIRAEATRLSGQPQELRVLLKRAKLTRLARALSA